MRIQLAWALASLLACKESHHGPGDPAEALGQAERDGGTPSGMVRIDPEMMRDLRVTTVRAEARSGGEGVTVLGEVGVNEDAYAEIGSPIPARVVKLLVGSGDAVVPGQPLAELTSVELGKARADLLRARARADLARRALARQRSLAADQIAAERTVQEAEAEAAASEADLRAGRATLRALGASEDDAASEGDARLVLRSPVAGVVIERAAARGQVADPARPLYRVADLTKLWLTVHAFERDAVRVKRGASARLGFPALPGRTFSGTVLLVGGQVDPRSRTIPIRIEVTSSEGTLRPGMSGAAWVPLGDAAGTIVAVPAAALQRAEAGWCVFLPRGEGLFEMRPVGRGRDLGGEVEILNGLRPDEEIVVDGAFLLKAEADKARGSGEHHEH